MAESGTLYIVATPIGHPEDVTLRALRVLGEVDRIAAEDTRSAARLLARHDIRTPLISCHEHNERDRLETLLAGLRAGDTLALVSEAGTPSVSDPGFPLVRAAVAEGMRVVPVPGPSAAVAALSVSGLPTDAFTFLGFPPRKAAARRKFLEPVKALPHTLIFYESPHRLSRLLADLVDVLGDRDAVLGREMTKPYEEFVRGALTEIARAMDRTGGVKGECTLLVAGASGTAESDIDLRELVTRAMKRPGATVSGVAKDISKEYGLPRKAVYAEALNVRENEEKNGQS
ncbi:MAG: 16S rRNA (cytidine(1402)-2'-O)-methyltransferase [Desulfococcaceae bacterium]